jgi:tape measure domain-containing protein
MAGLHFDITGDNSNFIRKLHECENGVRNTSKQIEQSGLSIEDLFNRMTKAAAAFGAGFTAKELISNIAQVRGEFQQLEVAFKTMLGSEEKANALMQQLVKTAATTPFDLQGVANGAKQLLAYGENVENVNDDLIRLGNIAAGLSQPLGDIVYLYGTTMTQGRLYTQDLNQFTGRGIPMIRELAKQFNVAENEVKGLVEAGKVGFPEVQKVIMSLTNEGGMFYNLMQEQSKTITGQISNIEDAIATMFNEIGKANEGIINDALSGVSYLVENYEKVGRVLLEIVGTYGAYRTALMVTSSLQALQASGITALTTKEAVHYGWLVLTKKAQDALNLSMLKNPYVLAAAAIAGLAYGIYKLATAETETERAVRKTNEALEAQEGYYEGLKNKASELSNILSNESKSIEERFIAYRQLQRLMPEVFQNMDWETAKRKTNAELIKLETDELLRRQRIGLKTKVVMSQQKIQGLENSIIKTDNRGGYTGALKEDLSAARKELEIYTKALDDFEKADEQAKKDANKPTVYNKEYWEGKKKEAEDARNTLDVSKKNSDEWNKYTKQIQEAQKQIDKYSDSKTINNYNSIIDQQKKISELLDKQTTERKRKEQDLENQLTQSRIDAMAEGEAKIRAQRELDNKKEIQDLERQREDYIRTEIKLQRKAFDEQENLRAKQTKYYKKRTFDPSTVKVDTAAFDKILNNTILRQDIYPYQEEMKYWNEYLKEYGTFQQKKAAINEEYNFKISEATTKGAKKSLEKEKENKLKEVSFEELKSSINFANIFGNLDAQSTEALVKMRDNLKEVINKAAKDIKPTDLKALQDAFKEIDLKITVRNPLGELKNSADNYRNATSAVIKAQEDLNTVIQGGEVITKVYTDENGKLTTRLLTLTQAENNLAAAQSNRQQALSKLTQAANSIGQKGMEVVNAGNDVVGMLENFGVKVPEAISKTLDGIGQVMSGLERIDLTKPFSAITGAVSVLAGVGNTIAGLFGFGGADYSRYNEMVDEYNKLNEIWDELIDKKKEYIDMSYGDEARKAGEEAIDLIGKKLQSNIELGIERLNSGASAGSHSIGVRIRKSMSNEGWRQWDEFAQSIGIDPDAIGGRLTGLFSLTAEQLSKLQEDAPTFWAKLDDDVKGYLQDIIDCNEEIENMKEQLKETMTGVSFDSFYDNFVSTLSDMDKDSKDFADDFENYLKNAILSNLIANKYRNKIEALYDDWANKSDSNGDGIFDLTSSEADELRKAQQALAEEMIAERDAMAEVFGWTSSASSQESSKKGFGTEMTHEDAGELIGRFTALQIAGEEIKNQMIAVVMGINSLTSISSVGNEVLNNILTQHVITNSYLDDIAKYTKLLNDIKTDISEVRINTKGLSTR